MPAHLAQDDRLGDSQAERLVECLDREGLNMAREVARRYRDLRLGLADASLAVLAARHRTDRIVTFDERAFRAMTPLQGGAFTLLPADSS